MDDESEELMPMLTGYGCKIPRIANPREKKRISARKTAGYIMSKQQKVTSNVISNSFSNSQFAERPTEVYAT